MAVFFFRFAMQSRVLVVLAVVAILAFVAADDICLPQRHTAWVAQREFSSFQGRKEMFFKVYHDTTGMKQRTEFFPRHHARNEEITGFMIADFRAKLMWRGMLFALLCQVFAECLPPCSFSRNGACVLQVFWSTPRFTNAASTLSRTPTLTDPRTALPRGMHEFQFISTGIRCPDFVFPLSHHLASRGPAPPRRARTSSAKPSK